jgi:GDPmannose 4,6-dehydratase
MGHSGQKKVAFVTGITGQAGSYLAEQLLADGCRVHGLCRHTSDLTAGRWRLESIIDSPQLHLHYGDLCDAGRLARLLRDIQPQEIYNFAAQSHVKVSFDLPEQTADVTAVGCLRLLEAMRAECPQARFVQASSSELFGDSPPPQNEETPMRPRSPYATAKLFAYWTVRQYREAYRLHCSNAIFFNMESPRRSPAFVTRKITRGIARILAGKEKSLVLGNLDAMRDWGHCRDYMRGARLVASGDRPDDFVFATGHSYSVRKFFETACFYVGRKVEIVQDPSYLRPLEVPKLCGDSSKARRVLGWEPTVTLEQLVEEMVRADLEREGVL